MYEYRANVVRVVDGDTVICEMLLKEREDLGFHIYVERITTHQSIRLADVDTAELFSGTDRDAGKAAREFVVAWVADAKRGSWSFRVHTMKDKASFNRYIGWIWRVDTGELLADALVAAGMARRV